MELLQQKDSRPKRVLEEAAAELLWSNRTYSMKHLVQIVAYHVGSCHMRTRMTPTSCHSLSNVPRTWRYIPYIPTHSFLTKHKFNKPASAPNKIFVRNPTLAPLHTIHLHTLHIETPSTLPIRRNPQRSITQPHTNIVEPRRQQQIHRLRHYRIKPHPIPHQPAT